MDIDSWALALDIKMERGDHWVTLNNSRRVLLDKDGTVKAGFSGFVGKKVSELQTSKRDKKPPTVEYSHTALHPQKRLPDATKYVDASWKQIQQTEKDGNGQPLTERKARERAAKNYFRENLQNKFVETFIGKDPVQVHFTAKTWSEFFKDPNNFDVKVAIMPKLPDIIRKNMKTAPYQLPKHVHEDFDGFYHIEAKIPDPRNGTKDLMVYMDIGKNAKSQEDYTQYFYTARDEKMRPPRSHGSAPARGATVAASGNLMNGSITPDWEVVKIDVKENITAQDTAGLMRWLMRKKLV